MKIALVDDQIGDLNHAENFLRKYLDKNFAQVAASIELETFLNAQDMLKNFEPQKYDLIMLDIFMKPINGIQVAEIVRKRDKDAAIIFLTNSEDFILEGYKVFAVGYFLKPLAENAEQFAKTFAYVLQKIMANQKNLSVKLKGSGMDVAIPYKNIKFIDIDWHHHVCIHLSDKKLYPNAAYEKIRDELQRDERFIECYHRILVNMNFIRYMDGDDFVLSDETKIPISQRKSKDSKLRYMNHLLKIGAD